MTDVKDFTPRVARSILADVIETATDFVYYSQMVGIESRSAEDLEEALAHMPCLYCGVLAFKHDDDCPREMFRNKRFFERSIS